MTYDLFQQKPLVIILTLTISLIFTILKYGTVPLILAKARKKVITRKKYIALCYGLNFLIYVLYSLIEASANTSPYILWTSVFSLIGLKILNKKKLVEGYESDVLEDDPNRLTECKACGYQAKNYFEACPQCGKHAKRYVYLTNDNNFNT